MSYSLLIKPAAEIDLRDAFRWYEEKQPNLGSAFLDAVEAQFEKILDNPKIYVEIESGIRRSPTKTFPYWVIYTIDEGQIAILAVVDSRQDPEYIRKRSGA